MKIIGVNIDKYKVSEYSYSSMPEKKKKRKK